MTDQVNIKRVYVITMIMMVAVMSVIILTSEHNINAQMMAEDRVDFGNMNSSLSQAMITAENSVGNDSFAIAGFGINGGGHLAYTIIIDTHGPEFYNVTVDPRNGEILATEQLSQQELEKAHLEHSQKVLTEPHLMNNTFVH
jgi:hypothetical protein